ncbi:unnamed protein product [Polarella glacialis]|uniref:Cyclic nucleotide-binding domain-containing protein n=3 Tax=Polarella glacialis TaxID=89957 RepID=A0A813G777_POLGL|nr:unnamed protein product [Polarella glacialis]
MMGLRSSMMPLRAGLMAARSTGPKVAPSLLRFGGASPLQLLPRTCGLASMTRPSTAAAAVSAAVNAQSRRTEEARVVGGLRAMSTWRLRPYAAAGTGAMLPLSSLSAGFSKVGLSLLVLPWKALPMALAVLPTVWILPAMYRMIFQNSMRHTTASVFTVILYLVLSFMPVPCFENLFSELTFYGIALVSTFFMYTFFPEVLLHDFMFMHYLALFTIPLIPLAFAYMPMFASRAYLFLCESVQRSRSPVDGCIVALVRNEDASSQASGLIMPLEALELVCHHYREIEARERGALVTEFFAQTMRIQPAVCNKHRNIFAVETFGRSHVLFQEGTKPPLSVAHLYLVIEGELQLVYPQKRNRMGACRGKAYKEACGRGKFLGDAALFGESYPASVVTTKETKVLTLKAIDYLQKLLNRPGILERAQGYVPRGPPADDSEDAALENQNLLRKKVFESTMKSARIAHDAKTLQDTEWKLLHPKATLPRGRLPYGRAKVHAAAGLAAEETSTRPSSQASQDARDVHSADYLLARSFATSGPLGAGLAMLYLDAKIAQGCQAVDQLQAAHRSHTAYGYHVEDAGGARLPAGSLMSVSPGSVVLMSCGAMSPSPPVSREGPRKRQLHSR